MTKGTNVFLIAYFSFFFLMACSVFFIPGEDENTYNDYVKLTDVKYKAEVIDKPHSSGNLLVTEVLTFDVHAKDKDNPFWELWRALPEGYADGLKVDYEVISVNQIDNNGNKIKYEESPKLYWDDYDYISQELGPGKWYHSKGPYDGYTNFECVLFYVDGLYREKVTFEIQYLMHNATLRYGDLSELDLIMYSEETIKDLKSFEAQILIANEDMPKEGNYEVNTYGTNSEYFKYEESKSMNPGYHTFYINLDEKDLKFKPYNQFLEIIIWAYGPDKHAFTKYAPKNNYYYDDVLEEARQNKEAWDADIVNAKKNKKIILISSIIVSGLIVLYTNNKIKKIKRKNNFYKPTQEFQYYRDIPSDLDPYVAANIVFSKDKKNANDGDGYTAVLLNLVRKDYIEIRRITPQFGWNQNNLKIILKYRAPLNLNLVNPINTLSVPKAIPVITEQQNRPLFNTMAGTDHNSNTDKKDFLYSSYNHPIIKDSTGKLNNTNDTTNNVTNNIVNNITNPQVERYNIDNKKLESLSPTEEAYYNLLARHSSNYEVNMKVFNQKVENDYDNTDSFVRVFEGITTREGMKKGYFQKSNYNVVRDALKTSGIWLIILAVFIMIFCNVSSYSTRIDLAYGSYFIVGIVLIICGLYLMKISNKYILFTQLGEDEYAKWRGLYNFFNSFTLMNERTVIELPLWEKYLVYATAFGISEKVIKALEIRCPDFKESPMLNNNYYRSSSFRTSSSSFSRSTRSASSSSRYGGGSYGGGRGGGGGGGGH